MLIGRERELALLPDALAKKRIVTIWGPGGVGKSSLAREVAASMRAEGAEVLSLGLRDVETTVDGLVAALARELELESARPAISAIGRALEARHRPLILVDEGESALEPLARVLSDLLARTAHVRVLLTSRALLGLAEEHPFELSPLARSTVDGGAELADTPAGKLFLSRARTLVPGFHVSPRTLALVLESTEGIPLSIELMAADCATLPEDAIVNHMPSSLEKTIARSWDRLEPEDREALIALATFSGSFSAPAAESILGHAQVTRLSALRRQSLVLVGEDEGETRFRLLTSVRTFARQQAAPLAWQRALAAHAAYFAEIARTANKDRGLVEELLVVVQRAVADASLLPHAVDALDALVDKLAFDMGQVRSLLDDVKDAHPQSPFLPRLLAARALASEAMGDLVTAGADLDLAERVTSAQGAVLDPYVAIARSVVAYGLSDTQGARKAAAPYVGNDFGPRIRGRVLSMLGGINYVEGHLEAALHEWHEAVRASREAKDERAEHRSTLRLAFGLLDAGKPREALATLAHLTGPRTPLWQRALASTYRGNTLRRLGDMAEARASHTTAISLFRQIGALRWESTALMDAGITELALHEHERAMAFFEAALALAEEVKDLHLQELISGYLAVGIALSGDLENARHVLESQTKAITRTTARSTEIHRAHIEYLEGTATRDDLERALHPDGRSLPSDTEHIRWAITLATRSALRRETPSDALAIAGRRVHLPGTEAGAWIDLSKKPTLERLLIALAKGHAEGRSLGVPELVSAGWPDENLKRGAAENRLRVALSALRALGGNALKGFLLHDKEGYRLASDLRVIDLGPSGEASPHARSNV